MKHPGHSLLKLSPGNNADSWQPTLHVVDFQTYTMEIVVRVPCQLQVSELISLGFIFPFFHMFAPVNSVRPLSTSNHQVPNLGITFPMDQDRASWIPWWHGSREEDAGCLTYAKNKKTVQWHDTFFMPFFNHLVIPGSKTMDQKTIPNSFLKSFIRYRSVYQFHPG